MASAVAAATSPAKHHMCSDEEGATKRARTTASDAFRKCEDLAAVFSENPLVAKLLLTSMMERSLAVPVDARHEVQQLLVATVGDTMATMESWKQAAVSEAQGKVEESQAAVSAIEAEISEYGLKAKEFGAAFAEKATELEAAQAVSEEKTEAVNAQRATNRAEDKPHDEAAKEFDRFVAASEAFAALRDRDEENIKKNSVSKVVTIGITYDFDSTMTETLPNALRRAERGPYDKMCISYMEEKLVVKQTELKDAVDGHMTAKESRIAALDQLEAAETVAKAAERACSETYCEAEAAQIAALEAEVASSHSLHCQQSSLTAAEAHTCEVAAALAAFVAGPVAAFKSLEASELDREVVDQRCADVELDSPVAKLRQQERDSSKSPQFAGA